MQIQGLNETLARGVSDELVALLNLIPGVTGEYEEQQGELAWSLQTNSAGSNAGVVELAARHSFAAVGAQSYADREDVVMWRTSKP
jgi:hypothetical protein